MQKQIRDPIHGLITFRTEDDHLVWRLLNTAAFQRLRRIRQLGFSELVFPGTTHSRLAHSIGVFHTARHLLSIIRDRIGTAEFDEEAARDALCAALLHDVGHGPFSHTFEGVAKKLGIAQKHEQWSMDIIRGDAEVQAVLGPEAAERVAAAINEEEPTDLYRSVVSSQFDADRLDYLRRDRYMAGVEIGRFDYDWICGSLQVADIHVGEGDDAETYTTVRSLVLGPKAFKAAEGYLQARHQLYSSVYLHKTTRAAEKMLEGILFHASRRLRNGGSGLPMTVREGPLATFLDGKREPDLSLYQRLDDTAVWSFLDGLANWSDGKDPLVQLARRLLQRRLYKCLQLDHLVRDQDTDRPLRLKQAVRSFADEKGWQAGIDILYDDPSNSGYKWYDWTAGSALRKVLIRDERNETIDVGQRSRIVHALEKERFYRVYLPDAEGKQQVEAMVSEEFR